MNSSRFGVPHSGGDHLTDKSSFKFGHRADNLEHKPASRHTEVEILSHADDGDAQGFEFNQCIKKMTERTAQTIKFPT
jgi:hypothetical protein